MLGNKIESGGGLAQAEGFSSFSLFRELPRNERSYTPAQATEWLFAAKDGNINAFAQIYGCYAPRLFNLLNYIGQDPTQAEDLTQETFIRVIDGVNGFDETHSADPWKWIRSIGVNLYKDARKSEGRRREREFKAAIIMFPQNNRTLRRAEKQADLTDALLFSEEEVVDPAINRADSEAVRPLIDLALDEAHLRPRERETLELLDIKQRSVEWTAELLGIDKKAVHVAYWRARTKLSKSPHMKQAAALMEEVA